MNGYLGDTYLISHHCIVNVSNQATELIRILDVIEKSLDFPFLNQWFKI